MKVIAVFVIVAQAILWASFIVYDRLPHERCPPVYGAAAFDIHISGVAIIVASALSLILALRVMAAKEDFHDQH